MSRLRLLVSSLLIASSLSTMAAAGVASTSDTTDRPAQLSIKLDRAKVRAALAARRKVVIERFIAYREARVYPWNRSSVTTAQHIWFDQAGNLCAAATLISYDWGRASTMKVGANDRGIQLAKVKRGEVADWMLTSGLTRHELVAIQVPPMGVELDELRGSETQRLYALYLDVERQLASLADDNLELATDALMKRPDLARRLLAGKLPGPGKFAADEDPSEWIVPPPPAPEPMPHPEPAA